MKYCVILVNLGAKTKFFLFYLHLRQDRTRKKNISCYFPSRHVTIHKLYLALRTKPRSKRNNCVFLLYTNQVYLHCLTSCSEYFLSMSWNQANSSISGVTKISIAGNLLQSTSVYHLLAFLENASL